MDRTPGPDPTTSYINWGTLVMNTSVIPEPNNQYPPEYCVVANYSQLSPLDGIWGWSDENCGDQHAFICKIAGAHRVASLHVRWRAAASLAGTHACVHMNPATQGIG